MSLTCHVWLPLGTGTDFLYSSYSTNSFSYSIDFHSKTICVGHDWILTHVINVGKQQKSNRLDMFSIPLYPSPISTIYMFIIPPHILHTVYVYTYNLSKTQILLGSGVDGRILSTLCSSAVVDVQDAAEWA